MKKIIKNNKKLIVRRHENAASQFYHDLHNSQNLTKKNCALYCALLNSVQEMVAPCSKFYGKIWVGFCLNTGEYFSLEVSF